MPPPKRLAVVLLVLLVLPTALSMTSSNAGWLLIPVLLVLLLTVLATVGTWNGRGSMLDVVAGQFEPEPKHLDRGISTRGGAG